MSEAEHKLHVGVKMWNIFAATFFIFLCFFMYISFLILKPINFEITLFDIVILILANFRLVRLFIYDNMALFIREWFLDLNIADGKYEYVISKNAFKLTMHKLMTCPWCFGIWTSFVSSFFYFSFAPFKLIFIILAISAVASFFTILTNLVGWYAEGKKKEVEKM